MEMANFIEKLTHHPLVGGIYMVDSPNGSNTTVYHIVFEIYDHVSDSISLYLVERGGEAPCLTDDGYTLFELNLLGFSDEEAPPLIEEAAASLDGLELNENDITYAIRSEDPEEVMKVVRWLENFLKSAYVIADERRQRYRL